MIVLGENSRSGTEERKSFARYNTRKLFWNGKQNIVCMIKGHTHSRRNCETKWFIWDILFISLNSKNKIKNDFPLKSLRRQRKSYTKSEILAGFKFL